MTSGNSSRTDTTPQVAAESHEVQRIGDPKPIQDAGVFPRGRGWLPLLLVVAFGVFLRFYMLGAKSLWLDEAFSVYAARLPWPEFLRTMWWGEANMALFYVLLRGWIHFGDSEFLLRSLSALFGVAAILAVYAFGSRFLSRQAGLIAATLLAIHSFHIHYSQDLRSYGLLTLLLILSSYAFLEVLENPKRSAPWVIWVVCSALSLYAHMFAVLALASQWLLLVLSPARIKRLGFAKLLTAGLATGILAAPMAAVVILEHKEQLDWVPRPNLADISALFQDLVGAGGTASQGSFRGLLLLCLYVATWVVALGGVLRSRASIDGGQAGRATFQLLASWFAFPIAAMIGISFLKPILAPRYLLMCVPAAVLLASWGLVTIARSAPRGRLVYSAVLLLMVILALWGTEDHFASFRDYGSDWRGVTRYIRSEEEPGDAAIFYTFTGHREFDYYAERTGKADTGISAPTVLFPLPLDRAGIEKRTEPFRRVWFVVHHMRATPVTDAETEVMRTALESHFRLVGERKFSGSGVHRGESGTITVALYVAAPSGQDAAR